MTEKDPRPYLVVTVLLDPSARAAAITRSHGDAMERAIAATKDADIAGLDIAELNISPKAFSHLRKNLSMPPGTIALYDLFPLASHLAPEHRKIAGQFLAAEALWALEEQGLTNGAPAVERFTLPDGWSKDPKEIRNKLVEVGALDLSAEAIQTFAESKKRWDATSSPTPDVTALASTAGDAAPDEEADAGGDAAGDVDPDGDTDVATTPVTDDVASAADDDDDSGHSDTEPPPPAPPTEPPPPAPPTERPPPPVFDEETGEPKEDASSATDAAESAPDAGESAPDTAKSASEAAEPAPDAPAESADAKA